MLVDHVDQIIAGRQHVSPCAKIFLKSVCRTDREIELRLLRGEGLRRKGFKLNPEVVRILCGIITHQLRRRGSAAGNDHGLWQQLRSCAVRIEVAEDLVHSRPGKFEVVEKGAIRLLRGMVMEEK